MKKICFGIAIMMFGFTINQYAHFDWIICLTSIVGLGFAAWVFLSKEEA